MTQVVLRLAITIAGFWLTVSALSVLWPKPDRVATQGIYDITLAPLPSSPVILLVIGIDADTIADRSNQAAPAGAANADALMLLQVMPKGPLQLLQLPTELGVQLPGLEKIQPLSATYRYGGVALTSDVISELLGLASSEPHRYVVLPRRALRLIVDSLGEVEVSLIRAYRWQDRAQNYIINLRAGRQTLNGNQAEQLARFRQNALEEFGRRQRQQTLLRGIERQLRLPSALALLPSLLSTLANEVETDLTQEEWLSLAAAMLSNNQPTLYHQLSLAPRIGQQVLRQLDPSLTEPLWPN